MKNIISSKEIVEKYQAKLDGQQLLFPDYDLVLRNTFFKSIDLEFDRQVIAHWWMNVYVPGTNHIEHVVKPEVYKSWFNAVMANFKYILSSGYYPNINQQCVKIAAIKNDELKLHLDDLFIFLPYIKYHHKEEKSYKRIEIFEHTLSEYGSFYLTINEINAEYCIYKTVYSHDNLIEKFDNLEECIGYIKNNIYYKKNNND